MIHNCGEKSWKRKIVLVAGILTFCCSVSLAADLITGVVRNQSQGRPAAGDEVILLGAGKEAQEEARAKTDSQGAFTLELRHPDKAAPGPRNSSRRQLRLAALGKPDAISIDVVRCGGQRDGY
jgi:hypothetical protein